MKMEYNLNFDLLCGMLSLGQQILPPEQIYGGHLHRMYHIRTGKGNYAVKALNPAVMARPEAMGNILNAESIARLAAGPVPALPALVFGDTVIPQTEGQYYLIYDWIDGQSLFDKDISAGYCHKIGRILADIHSVDVSSLSLDSASYNEEKLADWQYYLERGKKEGAAWSSIFNDSLDKIHEWNNRLIAAGMLLSSDLSAGHGDLEPKNVMWSDGSPIVIDWEAAGLINPMHDLVETALYWASDKGDIIEEKFKSFVSGYCSVKGRIKADWKTVLDKGLGSKLGWLEYSLKRSLGIESTDPSDRKVGTEHVFGTIAMLHNYDAMSCNVIDWLDS